MGAILRVLLKFLGTILLWCTRSFRGTLRCKCCREVSAGRTVLSCNLRCSSRLFAAMVYSSFDVYCGIKLTGFIGRGFTDEKNYIPKTTYIGLVLAILKSWHNFTDILTGINIYRRVVSSSEKKKRKKKKIIEGFKFHFHFI